MGEGDWCDGWYGEGGAQCGQSTRPSISAHLSVLSLNTNSDPSLNTLSFR